MAKEFYENLYERQFPLRGSAHHTLINDRFKRTLSLVKECQPRDILELGFEDPAYFSRVYAAATGVSPRAFRAQLHGEEG